MNPIRNDTFEIVFTPEKDGYPINEDEADTIVCDVWTLYHTKQGKVHRTYESSFYADELDKLINILLRAQLELKNASPAW
jgi:hypothetical protein